jgi:protein gp37
MGAKTRIEWTDHTFNPWWGCAHVSPGCVNCYAEAFSKRTGHDVWGAKGERRLFGDKHWNEPVTWDAAARQAGRTELVFCASMADVFEEHPAVLEARIRLWRLIAATPNLCWQLLTKRPENVLGMVPGRWRKRWPENAWIGTTTEDQQRADERIPVLLNIPAPVRFLSCEPLLGPVDLSTWLGVEFMESFEGYGHEMFSALQGRVGPDGGLHWVIVGGESGLNARPMSATWARELRDQCVAAGTAFFFKQWGGRTPKANGRELDGRTWDGTPSRPVASQGYSQDEGGQE